MKSIHSSSGFTVVEVLVTLVIVSLFMGLFFQTYMAMESQRIAIEQRSIANNIAYANIKKISVRPTNGGAAIACSTTPADNMDLSTGAPAPGLLLGDSSNPSLTQYGFKKEDSTKLPNAVQTVRAFAPSGCPLFNTLPMKIVSTVTYGATNERVSHVIYIK